MERKFIPVNKLREFILQSFIKSGVPTDDARIIADVLISSDLRGIESHGIGRLKMYLDRIKEGILNPVTRFEIVKESPGTALVDGNNGMGHVIAYKAMNLAIEKAGKNGVGAVSVRNSSHFGIAGYYALMAIRQNMAGFAFTNARPAVAPTFGNEPMMGTNPIAFGVPTDEDCPFLLDMGTPIIQRGKIEVLSREEKPVPGGWVIDYKGNYLTNADEILDMLSSGSASLLPLGGLGEETSGYKGYGLTTMVEILSSAFGGGPFLKGLSGFDDEGNKTPHRLGHFFMAIDISHFIEVDEFRKIAGSIVRSLRKSGKLPGQGRIYTAGEKEFEKEEEILKTGIPVNRNLYEIMLKISEELDICNNI